jgi:hypothetical protein
LNDLDSGIDHPFGSPTGYELLHDGKRYPQKAVIGLACGYSIGRMLRPEEFNGGESPGQANFVLRKLGFTVVRKRKEAEEEKPGNQDWSEQEVALIVADYFAMLEKELLGKPLSKTKPALPVPEAHFGRTPRVYILTGSLKNNCELEPIQYRATI